MRTLGRRLAAVIGGICILVAVVGLLAGNVRYRMLTPALYQNSLLRSGVYEQIAVSLIEEVDLALVRSAAADQQLPRLAEAILPAAELQTITEDALLQTAAYLNQPGASSTISITTWGLLEHLDEIIVSDTCSQLFAQQQLCTAELPALITHLRETTSPETAFDLAPILTEAVGEPHENVVWMTAVTTTSLQIVGVLVLLVVIGASFAKAWRQLMRWLGYVLMGTGIVLGILLFGLGRVMGEVSLALVEQTDNTRIMGIINQFLSDVGVRFANGMYGQAAVCLLAGAMLWLTAAIWKRRSQRAV